MYQLDSGLLGIILTLLLIAFNFYASYRKKKRLQIKRKNSPIVNTESSAGRSDDMEEPYRVETDPEPVGEQEKNAGGLKDIFEEIQETIQVPREDDEGLFDFFFNKSQEKSGSGGTAPFREPGAGEYVYKNEREETRVRGYESRRERAGEQSPMSATDPDRIAHVAFNEEEEGAVYDNGFESVENSGSMFRFSSIGGKSGCDPVVCDSVDKMQEEPEAAAQSRRSGKPDLKRRLKTAPRDLILFSELLRPRYKDF